MAVRRQRCSRSGSGCWFGRFPRMESSVPWSERRPGFPRHLGEWRVLAACLFPGCQSANLSLVGSMRWFARPARRSGPLTDGGLLCEHGLWTWMQPCCRFNYRRIARERPEGRNPFWSATHRRRTFKRRWLFILGSFAGVTTEHEVTLCLRTWYCCFQLSKW